MSGAIASSFPNRLFGDFQQLHANTEAQEIQNQFAPQRNALLQAQTQQTLGANEIEYMARASQSLLGLGDEGQMAAQYPSVVASLQQHGFAKNAPSQFPGVAALQRLAALGTSSEKQAEQRGVAGAVNSINLGNRPGVASTPGVTTSTTAGDIEVPAQERARLVYDGMIKRGADHATAAAWAANALHESSANPNTGPGDRGASQGLFMWNGPRLQAYIAKNGHSPRGAPLDEQLDFIMHELETTEAPARAYLDRAAPEDKAAVISREFLRPKDREGEQQRRSATAQRLATLWGAGGAQPGTPGGGRVQLASRDTGTRTDATTTATAPGVEPPAQTPTQQTAQQQPQAPQQQPTATLPPELQTNEAGLTARDLEVLVPLQKLAATGNRAAAERFQNEIQQRQNANRTAQQQWQTRQDTLRHQAQTEQNQAQTAQLAQQRLAFDQLEASKGKSDADRIKQTLLTIGPKIKAGTAKPEEIAQYTYDWNEYAYGDVSEIPNPDGTGTVKARVPREVRQDLFPPPPGQTGALKPQIVPGTQKQPEATPTTVIGGILTNADGQAKIMKALKDLSEYPEGVGILPGGQPNLMSQWTDPKGVKVRASVADVAAHEFHALTGASQTASEAGRLKPFVVDPTDTAEAIKTKLTRALELTREANLRAYRAYGPEVGGRRYPVVEEAIIGSIPQTAIDHFRKNQGEPGEAAKFDKIFGKGTAKMVLDNG